MDNQHRHIKGYRELSEQEIADMNAVKDMGEQLRGVVEALQLRGSAIDQRAVSIGRTQLQDGIMWLVRAIAQPTTF